MKKAAPEVVETVQLATFLVGDNEYAVDIMAVKEILQPLPMTPMPRMPALVEGVIELRGRIIPIVDLRKRFDVPAPPFARATKIVIAPIDGQEIGFVVDGVNEVIRVAKTDLGPPPALARSAPFYRAVLQRGGKVIMVLDVAQLFSAEEKLALGGGQG